VLSLEVIALLYSYEYIPYAVLNKVCVCTIICPLSYRVWEKIAESMQMVARSTTGLKAKVASWAQGLGLKANLKKQSGRVSLAHCRRHCIMIPVIMLACATNE